MHSGNDCANTHSVLSITLVATCGDETVTVVADSATIAKFNEITETYPHRLAPEGLVALMVNSFLLGLRIQKSERTAPHEGLGKEETPIGM